MTDMIEHMRDVLPAGADRQLFFEKVGKAKTTFWGGTKFVYRFHLATKDAQGETVILDKYGVKESKGLFATTLRIQGQYGRFLDLYVNTQSLKKLLTRLGGKKVLWLTGSNRKAIGTRVLKAAHGAMNQVTKDRVKDVVARHAAKKKQIDIQVLRQEFKNQQRIEVLEQEIEELEQKIPSLQAHIKKFSGTRNWEKQELRRVKEAIREIESEIRQLSTPSSMSTSSSGSYASLSSYSDELASLGFEVEEVPPEATPEVLEAATDSATTTWKVEKEDLTGRMSPEQEQLEARIKEEAVRERTTGSLWWVQHVHEILDELDKDKARNKDEIDHYEKLLERHGQPDRA